MPSQRYLVPKCFPLRNLPYIPFYAVWYGSSGTLEKLWAEYRERARYGYLRRKRYLKLKHFLGTFFASNGTKGFPGARLKWVMVTKSSFIRKREGSPLRDTGKLLMDIDDTDITTSIVSTSTCSILKRKPRKTLFSSRLRYRINIFHHNQRIVRFFNVTYNSFIYVYR